MMSLLTGLISKRTSFIKPQGAGRVYANADHLQSSLDLVDKSIQRPTVVHELASQENTSRHKDLSRGSKQAKHVRALSTIASEGDVTEGRSAYDAADADTGPTRLRPLNFPESAWWNVESSFANSSTSLTFVTSALNMLSPSVNEGGVNQSTALGNATSTSFDTTARHASSCVGSDNALHSSATDDNMVVLNTSPILESTVKPLPSTPTHSGAESPKGRGIIDAFEYGAMIMDEKHPALEPSASGLALSGSVKDEQKKIPETAHNMSANKVHKAVEAEKQLYEENVRRVRNNESIENIRGLDAASESSFKESSKVDLKKILSESRNSPDHASRNPLISRIPQANVSLYGSPVVRKALASPSASIFQGRAPIARLHRVSSRIHNEEAKPSISPRTKYGRSAPRIDPEADFFIFGDDPNAPATNSFQSIGSRPSLRASKDTEDLILNQRKTSYQATPSKIPQANPSTDKYPPRVSSLKGSPEANKVERKFPMTSDKSQSAVNRLSRPTASSNARAVDARASITGRNSVPKTRTVSGTPSNHSTRKSFSGRLSSMLPNRRRTKSSPKVEMSTSTTGGASRSNGRAGVVAEKRTFGFRKHKAAPEPEVRDMQENLNFINGENPEHMANATDVVSALNNQKNDRDDDDDPTERLDEAPRRGHYVSEGDAEEENTEDSICTASTREYYLNAEQQPHSLAGNTTAATAASERTLGSTTHTNVPGNVSGSTALPVIRASRASRASQSILNTRTRGVHDGVRPHANPAARQGDSARSSLVRRDDENRLSLGRRPSAAAAGARPRAAGRYSSGRHVNMTGPVITHSPGPRSLLDSVDAAIQEPYLETHTTRMLNSLMVDARNSLTHARSIANNIVHDSATRARLLEFIQDERSMLECLHHLRRSHVAAGVVMFDLFRGMTEQVDETIDHTIEAADGVVDGGSA